MAGEGSVSNAERRPRALWRLYDYAGAHAHALRPSVERQRCALRIAMATAGVTWLVLRHRISGSHVSGGEMVWVAAACVYAATALAYCVWLRRRSGGGGAHTLYVFMFADALLAGWAAAVAPALLVPGLLSLFAILVLAGLHYGPRALRLQLGLCCVAAVVPALAGAPSARLEILAAVLLMVVATLWRFGPLLALAEEAKVLEIERARLESLQESLRTKSEFLSRVSHELRSPLQGIISALDLFEERYAKAPEEAELTSQIRRGATSLNTQLRDLLTIARGEIGRLEIQPLRFEAIELTRSIAEAVRAEAHAKGLDLVTETPDDPIFVVADPARIDQIVTNLLTNAVRHTATGTVKLTLHAYEVAQGALHYSVCDTGPGIEPERIVTLFDPYTRYGAITHKGEGAGLGLAVVRSVLQFLGGKITVQSEPGRGTTFDVRIPAERLDEQAPVDANARPKHVLVVDDREEVLAAITGVVRELGYECDTAPTVARAANLLAMHSYDIAFVDLNMPIKSGFELASETRRGGGPNARSKLISISAVEVPEHRRGWPFDAHMTKPVTAASIRRAIDLPAPGAAERK